MEIASDFNKIDILSLSKDIYRLEHQDVGKIQNLINDAHRDPDVISEQILNTHPELSSSLEKATKYLKSLKEKDTDSFIEESWRFTSQVSPFMRNEADLLTLYYPQAEIIKDYLNNGNFIEKFKGENPIGLDQIMPHRKPLLSTLSDLLKSRKTLLKEELNEAMGLSISFQKKGWPFDVSMKNLMEVGSVVASEILENPQSLMEYTSKRFPGSEAHVESMIKKSKPILLEAGLSALASFEVKVYGQLAKSKKTDPVREQIVYEAVNFRDLMAKKSGVIKISPSFLRGFFYYKALQVRYEQPSEVWGSVIKSFDWKDVIPDRRKRYMLSENNMWIIK